MNPLTLLNDLITEHGSAAILRQQLEKVRGETATVLDENKNLRLRVAELEGVVRGLTDELRAKAKSGNLPAEAQTILLRFFKYDVRKTDEEVAAIFKMHPSVAKHRMDLLREREYIRGEEWVRFENTDPERMKITPEGRAYIVENGLHTHLELV
jgi:hypothetical protein